MNCRVALTRLDVEGPPPGVMQRKVSGFCGPFALCGCAEHRREISLQFDSEDARLRRQSDGVNKPERLSGLGARFRALQGVSQRRQLLAIQLGYLLVHAW